jgi:hypothetical protein
MEHNINISNPNSIVGIWKGKVSQVMFGQDVEILITMDLLEVGDKIAGTASLDVSNIKLKDEAGNLLVLEPATLDIEGGYYENRFLQLNYKNPNESLQFGYIVIDLYENSIKADDHFIKGLLIGYGPRSKKIINGEIILKKCSGQ